MAHRDEILVPCRQIGPAVAGPGPPASRAVRPPARHARHANGLARRLIKRKWTYEWT